MAKDQYVSFDIAKLLEQKGFVFKSDMEYHFNGTTLVKDRIGRYYKDVGLPACTQQAAMSWLRDDHLLHICIYPRQYKKGVIWIADVYDEDCDVCVTIKSSINEEYESITDKAIKFCLENYV